MGIFHSMLEEYRTSDSPISSISSAGFPDLAVSAAFEGPTRRLLIQSVTASTPASAADPSKAEDCIWDRDDDARVRALTNNTT